MIRRQFIKNVSTYTLGGMVTTPLIYQNRKVLQDVVVGHNSHQYKIDLNWGILDNQLFPVNDCHEMVQDSQGRIVLLTNHTKNNVIIYDKKGNMQEVWGTEFPGAHGLTLNVENGEDFLYIADNNRHEVIKTTIDGKVVQIFPFPADASQYNSPNQYIPTETTVVQNGDVYIADGYGEQNILHYDAKGKLINVFGGRGNGEAQFQNAHGICVDTRSGQETLLITARMQNKLKRFTLGGELLEIIDLPGAYICRPVIHKDNVYLATIWSGDGSENTGFVSILNKKNQLISAPGGSAPAYVNDVLQPMYQTLKIFKHPHDVCVDDDENLYIAQWNSGKTYPIKLYRI